ncbi:MAG: hypothetical protein ABIK99_00670 [candidate division WOR-3 bacterium]
MKSPSNQEEDLKSLSEKITYLSTELKRLREENRRLREMINFFQKRDEKLKKKLKGLLDKIEKFF